MSRRNPTMWTPAARLAGRTSPPRERQPTRRRRDPRLTAAAILAAAAAIAVSLWLIALWAQGRGTDEVPVEADEAASHTIDVPVDQLFAERFPHA